MAFSIILTRKREEKRVGEPNRTIGEYKCYWNDEEIPGLSGQMVECRGPGDNTFEIGNMEDRRITAGTYPLALHHTAKFSTLKYTSDDSPSARPRPAIRLNKTNERSGILIHPAQGWKWSVGCLNPARGLTGSASKINYKDSRQQVIDIIDFIKSKTTMSNGKPVIPNAKIIIIGEPVQ